MMRTLKRRPSRRYHQPLCPLPMREPSNLITRKQVAEILSTEETNRRSVCFTGHRHLPGHDVPAIITRLDRLLEQCYRHGYRDFYCGGALGFDMLAAERVMAMQRDHSGIRLILVIPCSDQMRRWTESEAIRYERILYAADDIRVLSSFYYDGCMQVRNRYMVDRCGLCITYFRHQKGGTASTVAYAVSEQIPVLNVAMEDVCASFPER